MTESTSLPLKHVKDYPQDYLLSVASNVPATAQHVTQPGHSQGSVFWRWLPIAKGPVPELFPTTIPSFTFPNILQTSIHTSQTQRSFFLHLELHKSLQFLRTSAPVLTLFTRSCATKCFFPYVSSPPECNIPIQLLPITISPALSTTLTTYFGGYLVKASIDSPISRIQQSQVTRVCKNILQN